jgi:hypothetical protein
MNWENVDAIDLGQIWDSTRRTSGGDKTNTGAKKTQSRGRNLNLRRHVQVDGVLATIHARFLIM